MLDNNEQGFGDPATMSPLSNTRNVVCNMCVFLPCLLRCCCGAVGSVVNAAVSCSCSDSRFHPVLLTLEAMTAGATCASKQSTYVRVRC